MARDKDDSVAVDAIELLTHLLQLGFLKDNDGNGVSLFVWDKHPRVRDAAARFVKVDSSDVYYEEETISEEEQMNADIKEVLTIIGSVADEKTETTQRSHRQTDRPPPRKRREVPNRRRAKPSSVPQEDEPLIAMEKAAAVTRSERSKKQKLQSDKSPVPAPTYVGKQSVPVRWKRILIRFIYYGDGLFRLIKNTFSKKKKKKKIKKKNFYIYKKKKTKIF
eukprot:986746_1